MKNRQKDHSFCNVYGNTRKKHKKDSFCMIECVKEILIRLYSIKFPLSISIHFELHILEINRETSTLLDKFCFGSHLGLVNGNLKIK